ncbi:hypothetical protein ACKU27_26860 [Sphingobium yanoikuyae]|uniref:hypothetical protein n=1 Tax=Sphingobium sp. IP1 TaxID=2021637 RepID=UPI00117A7748|nr:hypothetical protein [Sphingobium sp. IP1]
MNVSYIDCVEMSVAEAPDQRRLSQFDGLMILKQSATIDCPGDGRERRVAVRVGYFDPTARAAEKAAARRADSEALASGRISAAELNKRNFALAHVDFSNVRIDVSEHNPRL